MIKDIAVVIPALNEEKTIGNLVSQLKKIFEKVIVVNDGSTDRTEEKAKENGGIVLTHKKSMGKGEALKTGFKFILKENISAVITMDGDGQHLVEDVFKFIEVFRKKTKVGIFVGKRKILATEMPFIRRLTNISMSAAISLLSFQWIPDTQCGYRLIRREVLEKVKLLTSHFETESEILIKSSWKGFKIYSIPISTVYRGEKSKIKPITDTLRFFLMLLIAIFPPAARIKWRGNEL